MPEKGDKIIISGKEFEYTSYGNWEPVRTQAQIIDDTGLAADVIENINTGDNELLVNLQGNDCVGNSSNDPLAAGASFTGSIWKDTLDYGMLTVSVVTDEDSAIDGLDIQWSTDGINVDDHDYFTLFANTSKTYTFGPAARYARIKYTNGSSPQNLFKLNTVLRKVYVKPSSHRINDDIVGQDDAELTTTILKVQTNDPNTYKNVDVQNPLPTDGDSIYGKDLDLTRSSLSAGWTGSVTDLFNDSYSTITNTTSNNPKTITLTFKRPFQTNIIGMAVPTGEGDFSNTKIEGGLVGSALFTITDESADSTKKTLLIPGILPTTTSKLIISFSTADTVTLSSFASSKALQRISRIQGLTPDGVNKDVSVTQDGDLSVSVNSSGLAIAKGEVSGTTFIHKFGNTPDFDTTDGVVDIWDGANNAGSDLMVYTYSATADIDSLSSSDNSDTQDIEIQGLDTNFDLVTQTITLTGQTRVALSTNLVRVFRLMNIGSTDLAGTAYCFVNVATTGGVPNTLANIRAEINNGNNQTLMAIYTIPNGKTGYMRGFFAATAGASKSSNYLMDLYAKPFGQVFQLKHRTALEEGGVGHFQHHYIDPEVFTAKTDIVMRTSATAAGVTAAAIAAGFDIVLIDN